MPDKTLRQLIADDSHAATFQTVGQYRQALLEHAENIQGEPVAVVDDSDDGLFIDFIYGENGNPLRRGDKLYTRADFGEVERLREQLVDRDALLRDAVKELRSPQFVGWEDNLAAHIDAALSASAEPAIREPRTTAEPVSGADELLPGWLRNAALEEAARACEARIGTCEPGLEGNIKDVDGEAQQCADEIRALKTPGSGRQPSGNAAVEPEDDSIALDRLADYIADTWPMDKKYDLEEICQRLHAMWPGAFMPAQPQPSENAGELDERALFEAAFEGVFFSACFERDDDGSYAGRGLQGAWLGWQKARASLPVGVPDGWALVPVVASLEMKNAGRQECERQGLDPESVEMQPIWCAMLAAAPSAPAAGPAPTPEFVWVRLLEAMHGDNGGPFTASTEDYRSASGPIGEMIMAGYFLNNPDDLDGDIWLAAAGEAGQSVERFERAATAYAELSAILNRIFERPTLSVHAVPAHKCATCQDSGIVGHSDICPDCQESWIPDRTLPPDGQEAVGVTP